MENSIDSLVDSVIEHSKVDGRAANMLRTEIANHCADHLYDALLSGKTEEEAIIEVVELFGSPENTGMQFRRVYRPLDWIPFIGPLFYYSPLQHGMRYMVLHIFGVTSVTVTHRVVHLVYEFIPFTVPQYLMVNVVSISVLFLAALLVGIQIGLLKDSQIRGEVFILSYIPFLFSLILFCFFVLIVQEPVAYFIDSLFQVGLLAGVLLAHMSVAGIGATIALCIQRINTYHSI